MRLGKIKLAGFKSFVDPTTLVLPSNLVGIVGPNGCGKSNVIDAVRWVMGESSAKHLRGDSMADVIFNGSTSRKPVGQASIELLFDNGDGSLGGPYAQYSEIAIKRQVSRDGQSQYFLNGTRCRRRDITDIFLGTGLGPRSYAIIEQGMISRVVEARPEDLRVFIEEAAGISKYKERRRETENRMRHTQDNLARLTDLRDELGKQIQHLQRQAKTAERYKVLKQEERLLKAQLLALRWCALNEASQAEGLRISELETALEGVLAHQRQVEASMEKDREAHIEASDHFNEVQGRYYAAGADIARVEQAIQHGRERQEQLRQDLSRAERAWSEATSHLTGDQAQLSALLASLAEEEPALEAARAVEQEARQALSVAERTMNEAQAGWDSFNQQAGEPARLADVDRTRIQHLEQHLDQVVRRMARLEEERRGLNAEELEAEIESLSSRLLEAETSRGEVEQALGELRGRITALREASSEVSQALHRARERLHGLKGRLASLEALQQAALGKRQGAVADWLKLHALNDRLRLAEGLEVETGWELAAETVLGHHLEAVCVEDLAGVAAGVEGLSRGVLELFDTNAVVSAVEDAEASASRLGAKVRAPWPVRPLLAGIYAVETLDEALALRSRLGPDESVVTRGGVWLGVNWLRVNRQADEKAGILAREHEIKTLGVELGAVGEEVGVLEARQQAGREELRRLEGEQAELQSRLSETHRQHAGIQSQVGARQARLEQLRSRAERIGGELDELAAQKQAGVEDLGAAREHLGEMLLRMEALARERESLSSEKDQHRRALDEARQAWHAARDRAHRLALNVESKRTRRESLETGFDRVRSQVEDLTLRRTEMRRLLEDSQAPLDEAKAELDGRLAHRMAVEEDLKAARQRVEEIDAGLRELEQERHRAEEAVQLSRGGLEQARMTREATRVRLQTMQEQLAELDFEPEQLLGELPDEAAEADWLGRVEEIERRIARLGPINLAAIDEYAQQSQRKQYLDTQHQDLVDALTTLENAIRKIDRETRTRFRETFERVNSGFKDTFPQLFGGGHAYLELTSEDLLETGISVMARPPGKRNSTIHLLSGGEKALTAVALVFSIFELNPAPFCLLDEVDAPLDDANVGRFCGLVKSMSDRVQFMFITHNKTTMELSDHLVGVTMHEPGVSRLVQVDVEEAVQLAAV